MQRFLRCSLVLALGLLVAASAFAATDLEKKIVAETQPPAPSTRALDCTGAIAIACGDVVSGDNTGLVSTADAYSCVSWNESGGEVVYQLDLAVDQIVSATISNMTADLDVFILSACDETSCITYGNSTFTTDCLTAGTYYIVVDGYSGAESAFDLAVTCTDCPQPPENDNCETAIDLCAVAGELRDGVFDIPYTTIGAANDYDLAYGSCTGYSSGGGDLVWVVCLQAGGTLNVTQTGDYDMSLYLITDCADPLGSCVVGSDNCCTGADEVISYTSAAGGTYYLIVDGYSTEGTGTIYGEVTGCCGGTATGSDSWGNVKTLFR